MNQFVCSMTDLFGDWVPDEWIVSVFKACKAAPWHRYLFLTKNPWRYNDLICKNILPLHKNFWYGFSAEDEMKARIRLANMPWKHGHAVSLHKREEYFLLNTFLSLEPLRGGINMSGLSDRLVTYPQWVIVGAETGNHVGKVIPRRDWADEIAAFCEKTGIPVFYKESLRKLFLDLPESRFPWDTANQGA